MWVDVVHVVGFLFAEHIVCEKHGHDKGDDYIMAGVRFAQLHKPSDVLVVSALKSQIGEPLFLIVRVDVLQKFDSEHGHEAGFNSNFIDPIIDPCENAVERGFDILFGYVVLFLEDVK